jgi:rubrerythrin
MERFGSVEAVLDFAINEEEQAAQFYRELSGRMEKPWMQRVFEEFALEEEGHKALLLEVKQGRKLVPAEAKVQDLKISDYVVDAAPKPDMDYQEALILAMKKEKAAFKIYNDLAASTENEDLRQSFLTLAQEEAKHKLRFEIEYDDMFE